MRELHGYSSPLDDGEYVGEYRGIKHLTVQQAEEMAANPNPNINTGYIIIYGGLAADGWDHDRGTYANAPSLLNDCLDAKLYNCEWTIRTVNGRKGIWVIVKSHLNILPFFEGFIEYGEFHWCQPGLPLMLQFKAVTHYWPRIIKDSNARTRWSNMPAARYLFNTPYHTLQPTLPKALLSRVEHHLVHCCRSELVHCVCGIEAPTVLATDSMPTSAEQPQQLIDSVAATNTEVKAPGKQKRKLHAASDPSTSLSEYTPCKKRAQDRTKPPQLQAQRPWRCPSASRTPIPIPDLTNRRYRSRLSVEAADDLPGAGQGCYATSHIKRGEIIGIYENYTGGKRKTHSRIVTANNPSVYAIEYMGLTRDAWDPATNGPCCDVAACNDYLDETMDNATPGIHPLYPDLLLILATADIPGTPLQPAHIGLPYGAYFWCDDQHDLELQLKAIRRYHVDIHSSTEDTDGNWKTLANFDQLCAYFPATTTSSIMHEDSQPEQLPEVPPATTIPRTPKRKSDNASPAQKSSKQRTNVTALTRSVSSDPAPGGEQGSHHDHGSPSTDRQQDISRYFQCRDKEQSAIHGHRPHGAKPRRRPPGANAPVGAGAAARQAIITGYFNARRSDMNGDLRDGVQNVVVHDSCVVMSTSTVSDHENFSAHDGTLLPSSSLLPTLDTAAVSVAPTSVDRAPQHSATPSSRYTSDGLSSSDTLEYDKRVVFS